MITTTYTCDKCGENVEEDKLWTVGLQCSPGACISQYAAFRRESQWCRACMVKAHLLPNNQDVPPEQVPETPPTLEDLVRAIVREEVEG